MSFSNGFDATAEEMNSGASQKPAEPAKQRKGNGPFLGAGVRGFVEKAGPLPASYFLLRDADLRRKAFDEWLENFLNGHLTGHAALPYPECQVLVNHHYRFVWIKGHKVGSTSMRGPLGWICGDDFAMPENVTIGPYCSNTAFQNSSMTATDVEGWWNDYFVFGIVRNPYSRFSSSEEYIRPKIKPFCEPPTFAETCREPFIHTKMCSQCEGCLKTGGILSHHYVHFADQSTCLFTESMRPAVDFIGEVENMEEDLATIIEEINRRRDPHLPALVPEVRHDNVHRQKGKVVTTYAEDLFNENQFCLKSVSDFFHKDFLLLDYERLESLDA